MASLGSLQVGRKINWKNASLTRGLRHAFVPSLTGVYQGVPDLVDSRCSMIDIHNAAASNTNGQVPDRAFYSNFFVPQRWRLEGPQIVFTVDRDISILFRGYQLINYQIWGTLQAGGTNFFFVEAYADGAYARIGGYPAGEAGVACAYARPSISNWNTFVLVWDGHRKQAFMVADGKATFYPTSSAAVAGAVSTGPVGGGVGFGGTTNWTSYAENHTNQSTEFISHLYMWESALTPQAATILVNNPGAIFETVRIPRAVMAGGVVIPPEPTLGIHQHHHILGAV
jgi:hypothetical protein